MSVSYVVRIESDDAATASRVLEWLRGGHVAEVCAAGGASAEVVLLDADPGAAPVIEARYRFASRDAFAAYERDHAPRLRKDGLEAFPAGIRITRSLGDVRLELG